MKKFIIAVCVLSGLSYAQVADSIEVNDCVLEYVSTFPLGYEDNNNSKDMLLVLAITYCEDVIEDKE